METLLNTQEKRWWHYGHVWLIFGLPLSAIIASFITLYIALANPDPAIDDYYRKGIEINKTLDAQRDGLAPAVQARNHAQTGLKPASD